MFRYIDKVMHFLKLKYEDTNVDNQEEGYPQGYLSYNLKENLKIMKNVFGGSSDINYREFTFGHSLYVSAALIYVEGMTDKSLINNAIMKPFMYDSRLTNLEDKFEFDNLDAVKTYMLSTGTVKMVSSINDIVEGCLSGDTVLLIDGSKDALVIDARHWEKRAIEDAKTESVVRGPREGFSENINTNIVMLRRKIRNPDLIVEEVIIGRQTRTRVCIAYLRNIADPQLIKEIRYRLNRIKTDAILESGYIEQFIEDNPFSVFSTIGNSEKPDKVAGKILEGRIAVLVDGTPFVLTVPMLFIEGFQSSEDYYSRPYYAGFIRIVRFAAFGISVLGPAIYVSLSTFHQELIPSALLFTMAAAREGVPFPAVLEAGLMILSFEILREAGVRLPRPVGQAVSIVGALVIGQAAVSAGLAGAPMVIVTALTAVSSFIVTTHTDAASIMRILILIMAGIFGMFGISLGLFAVLIHLCSLRSFGTPYLSPLAPFNNEGIKDTFIRMPLWTMLYRPKALVWSRSKRQNNGLKPSVPAVEEKNK